LIQPERQIDLRIRTDSLSLILAPPTDSVSVCCHAQQRSARLPYDNAAPTRYAPIFMNNDNIAGVPFSSIIVGDMKLIRLFAPDSLGTDRFELYDLSTDTGEAFDLLLEDERAHWETVGNMNATLGDWLEQRGALIPGSSPRYWA